MPDDEAAAPATVQKLNRLPLKRILLVSVGFGAGFALAVSLIVGIVMLYKSRPKPWASTAITASFGDLHLQQHFDEQGHQIGFVAEFGYDLQNNTPSDYRPDVSGLLVFAKLPSGALSKTFGTYQTLEPALDAPAVIPPRAKARLTIRVHYDPPNFAKVIWDDPQSIGPAINRRLKEIDGLVILDQTSHYRIDLPNGWPSAKDDKDDSQ